MYKYLELIKNRTGEVVERIDVTILSNKEYKSIRMGSVINVEVYMLNDTIEKKELVEIGKDENSVILEFLINEFPEKFNSKLNK